MLKKLCASLLLVSLSVPAAWAAPTQAQLRKSGVEFLDSWATMPFENDKKKSQAFLAALLMLVNEHQRAGSYKGPEIKGDPTQDQDFVNMVKKISKTLKSMKEADLAHHLRMHDALDMALYMNQYTTRYGLPKFK